MKSANRQFAVQDNAVEQVEVGALEDVSVCYISPANISEGFDSDSVRVQIYYDL